MQGLAVMQSEVFAFLAPTVARIASKKPGSISSIAAGAVKVVEARLGHCTLEMTVKPVHMNPLTNQMSNGFLFAICGGLLVN